jgi:predicted phage tail protein
VACSQDRPEAATHLVTPAHVVDGSLSYGGTDLKSRHTVCLVTWNNPADGYKPDIEVVENAAGIRRYGWRKTDKVSVGCTSRGMAKRCGEWVLETELNETDLLTFTGGLYYADAVPGSRLKVLDPEEAPFAPLSADCGYEKRIRTDLERTMALPLRGRSTIAWQAVGLVSE